MKIGFLASGSGSALNHILSLTHKIKPEFSFYGASDRKCGALDVIQHHCIASQLLTGSGNASISQSASKFFNFYQCDVVILMYGRLVTDDLFQSLKCVNVHPSLLPKYTGFKAVKSAFNDKSSNMGVTLHLVDQSVDSGPIIAQIQTTPLLYNLDYWLSISYLMKISLVSTFLCSLKDASQCHLHVINSFSLPEAISEHFYFTNLLSSAEIVRHLSPIFCASYAASLQSLDEGLT